MHIGKYFFFQNNMYMYDNDDVNDNIQFYNCILRGGSFKGRRCQTLLPFVQALCNSQIQRS